MVILTDTQVEVKTDDFIACLFMKASVSLPYRHLDTHLLEPLSLCGHVQLQGVVGCHHLAHGEFHWLLLKHHGVAVGLLETRRLVVLRSDCGAKRTGHNKHDNREAEESRALNISGKKKK